MNDVAFIIISVSLVIWGIASIVGKHTYVALGRQRTIADATLTGNRAVLFGVICLRTGLIQTALILYGELTNDQNRNKDGTLSIIMAIGIAIVVLTFIFEFFVENLVDLRKRAMSKEGNNGKHGDSTNN